MSKILVDGIGKLNERYLCSIFRSIFEDVILSASNNSFVKIHDYEEFKKRNSNSTLKEKDYYLTKGYALNVPTYEKGNALNKFFIEKILKPYLNDEYMNSNYLYYRGALQEMINDPDIISNFYTIEETESSVAVGKIIKIGHIKNGNYVERGLSYMFNYDYYGDDDNKKVLDRIKRGILTAQLVQTNISWLENEDNAKDSLLVTGATLECSVSKSTSIFKATTLGNWATINNKPIGCIKDTSAVNIGSFGYCPNREKECKFSSAGGWENSDAMSFGGEDIMTEKSYIMCANGGVVKVKDSGQDMMKTNTKGSGR